LSLEAVKDLEQKKTKLIFLQTHREADYKILEEPFAYLSNKKFRIIYDYITKNYEKIGQIGDILVYSKIY
jgi:hypothetical protein